MAGEEGERGGKEGMKENWREPSELESGGVMTVMPVER